MSPTRAIQELAERLQEAATELSHTDIGNTLNDQICDDFPDSYACVNDIFGDDSDGDVVYSQGGETYRAPYTMSVLDGKRSATVDHSKRQSVQPRTVYDTAMDDDDHYAGMSESDKKAAKALPVFVRRMLSERFISKAERDNADDSDFAGAHRSFPILKPEDVSAAAHAIGRGVQGGQSAAGLKSRIISIAKRKGWEKYLPAAWQSDSSNEASRIVITGDVVSLREGAVGQDGSAILKLIAPGWGSSGYYSKETLRRAADSKVFPAGTKSFWDHPTDMEENERPEGSLRNLASVLKEDAQYREDGPAGPGLYARAEVVPEFRPHVEALAKHIGMSIRAAGKAKEGEAEGRKGPIIQELSRGISVDYVTTPGAGGKILQLFEAARRPQSQPIGDDDMDEATVRRLVTEAVKPLRIENDRLKEQLSRIAAPGAIREALREIRLPDASKDLIANRLASNVPMSESGDIDAGKLKALVEAEAKAEAEYLARLGLGGVAGMGVAAAAQLTEAERETRRKASSEETRRSAASLWGLRTKEGQRIFDEGRSAVDLTYNSAEESNDGVLRGLNPAVMGA